MPMYRGLRWLRICVSVAVILLLTWSIVDVAFSLSPVGEWLMHMQLMPAILGGAMIWLVLWVLVTLTFGRIYCSTVCPLGTLQDVAAHLGRRTGLGAKRRYQFSKPIDLLRFSIPLIVAACFFAGLDAVVHATDPYSVYAKMVMAVTRPATVGLGGIALAILVFLAIWTLAWRRGRLLCNTFCPAGGLLGLLGRQPIYRVDINTDLCIHCGKCEDVCKSECIDLRDCVVDNSRCVMCMDCTAICPNSAIIVRRGRYRLSTPMMMRTASQSNVSSSCLGPSKDKS